MIAEKLNFAVLAELPKGASNELRLNRPVFYTDEKVLKADTLYICKGLSLPAKISTEDGCALICIGFPEKTASDKAIDDILILDKDVDIFKLGNAVNKIFDDYDNLEEEQKLLSDSINQTAALSKMLIGVLETGSVNKLNLTSELRQTMNWSDAGNYKVLMARSERKDKSSTLGKFCKNLIKEFPETIAFIYHQSIVIAVNFVKNFKEADFNKLVQYLKDNHTRIGASNEFESIFDIRKFYRQAQIALNVGTVEERAEKLNDFSDCILPYFCEKITEEFDSHELSSPVYLRLEKYDKEYNTDYLKTLKVYLYNNQNAVQTAKDLYIHRATIIYRLKRICEIGQTELNDPSELLHLYLTFQLLER